MAKISINQDSLKERREWKRHKVSDGDNVFRFLPPFGDPEVHNGYPYRKWSIIWLTDPEKGTRRPYASPFSAGEDRCPVKDYADLLEKKLKDIEANILGNGGTEEDVKERLKDVRGVQWKLRLQHLYAYNACDQSGEVGLLEIKATAHTGVKKCMAQYIKEYAQDPTSLNSDDDDSGIWMNITKEGVGKATRYDVRFNETKEKQNGKMVRIDDRSPLPENVSENFDDLGYDLSSLYVAKSYNELKDILVSNITEMAKDIPDLIVDGFTTDYAVEEELPTKKKATTKGKKKVNLKLDDEDHDSGVPATSVDGDVFAMANDILGD